MSSDEKRIQDPNDELRALRARVEELERELTRHRAPNVSDHAPESKKSAAERAVEGFFDQPLFMLVIADLVEGRFLRVNKKLCEVLGYTESEILESSFLDRVHPDDHLKTMREMERLVAGEQTAGFRNRHRAADGTFKVFEWSSTVDLDRELCYAMAIVVDE